MIGSSRATAEGRETDDDRSTLDGISETRDHPILLADNTSTSASSFRLETLRDLDAPSHRHHHHDNASSITTDDDKRSRSNAAEFGDEGTRSATADFGDESESDDDTNHHHHHHHHHHRHHNVVNDDISAPPQPQPSFATVPKSFAELMEENEVLHNQLRNLQIAQKHQSEVIENLRSLTGCNEEIYGRALHLSQVTPEELDQWNQQSKLINTTIATTTSRPVSSTYSHTSSTAAAAAAPPVGVATTATAAPSTAITNIPTSSSAATTIDAPITTSLPLSPSSGGAPSTTYEFNYHNATNSRTLTQQLAHLAELVIRFVHLTVEQDPSWRPTLEQFLFTQISDAYFISLPFGTENQQLLNLAYADQIRRFQTTLGANFAKWYRRQTVQSLSLNPATKEYLEMLRSQMTQKLEQMLAEGTGTVNKLVNGGAGENNSSGNNNDAEGRGEQDIIDHRNLWNDVLDQCTALSLVIHGGEADVSIQPLVIGSKYDEQIMAVVGDVHADQDKTVKMVISPLFIDEEQVVLLPARVLLQ